VQSTLCTPEKRYGVQGVPCTRAKYALHSGKRLWSARRTLHGAKYALHSRKRLWSARRTLHPCKVRFALRKKAMECKAYLARCKVRFALQKNAMECKAYLARVQSNLFDRHRLSQISRLINIRSFNQCHMIS